MDRKKERYERCKKDGKTPKPSRIMESTVEQQKEIVKLYDEGLSSLAIARMFGVSKPTILKVLKRQGRKRRGSGEALRSLTKEQEEGVVRLYDEGLSSPAIADRLSVSKDIIFRVLERKGKKRRSSGSYQRKLTEEQEEEIVQLYDGGIFSGAIAQKFGVSKPTILNALERQGRKRMPAGGRCKLNEEQQKEIVELYKSGLSLRPIALRFSVSAQIVARILEHRGVKRRPRKGGRGIR